MVKCKYEGTGIWDGRCIGTKEVDPCPGYDKCKQYKPNYTTNADRIRAMSDEELAAWLTRIANGDVYTDFCCNPAITERRCGMLICNCLVDLECPVLLSDVVCVPWCEYLCEGSTIKERTVTAMNDECKWMQDEVCVNADCPACADYCPVANTPGVCKYEERGNSDAQKGKRQTCAK